MPVLKIRKLRNKLEQNKLNDYILNSLQIEIIINLRKYYGDMRG